MTFMLSEDKALRKLLEGLMVHDQKADGGDIPRQVGVWFGQPDQEIRTQTYPYIIIDMIDIQRDMTREMRGKTSAAYLQPAELNLTGTDTFEVDLPIPVNIDYQVTTYARHPRHDRELVAALLHTKLPLRFGTLETDDGTIRRLDVVDVSKRDVVENAKRLFVNAITVRISSEIAPSVYKQLYKVLEVNIDDHNEGNFIGPGQSIITA